METEHPKAEAFCRRLAGNRADGDDLYQDSLLTALNKFKDLREIASFKPWLYRIIVNTFSSRLRRPWWKKRITLTTEISDNLEGDNPTGVYRAQQLIRLAMGSLNSDERALITLFELEGWTIQELAELHGDPEGTIKSRLSRVREKMRIRLARHLKIENTQKEDLCVAIRRELS